MTFTLAEAGAGSPSQAGEHAHLPFKPVVLELDLKMTAEEALAECREQGLIVRNERELAGRAGSHHWHLGFPGRTGTLELSEWQGRVWLKVHPRRDGGWATALARELGSRPRNRRTA